jgi:hypothetical protein
VVKVNTESGPLNDVCAQSVIVILCTSTPNCNDRLKLDHCFQLEVELLATILDTKTEPISRV